LVLVAHCELEGGFFCSESGAGDCLRGCLLVPAAFVFFRVIVGVDECGSLAGGRSGRVRRLVSFEEVCEEVDLWAKGLAERGGCGGASWSGCGSDFGERWYGEKSMGEGL
jgi:hypothetical protein